jgi:hypothetical protein
MAGPRAAALRFTRIRAQGETPVTTQPGDEIAAGKAGRGHLWTSHADREHAIGVLKAAYVQGMLTKDELDARLAQAFTSRTHADLAGVTVDLPAGLSEAGSARPPARVRRRPLVRAAAGSGGCLAVAAAAVWGASILDPGPWAPSPYHSWAKPLLFIAVVSVLAALGILAIGMLTSWEQRRSRRQLPPRPGPGGYAPDGQRHDGTGQGQVPPGPRTGQTRIDLRAHQSPQDRQHTSHRTGRAPRGARPAPAAA